MYEGEAEVHRALGDPTRLRILALLRVREACVCELVARLPISQPAVSQHLRRLRQAGLVQERRHKYWTYYAIPPDLDPLLAQLIARLPHDRADEAALADPEPGAACALAPAGIGSGAQIGE